MKKKTKFSKKSSSISKNIFFLKKYNKLLPLLLIFISSTAICVTYLYLNNNNSKEEVWYSTDSSVTVAPKAKPSNTSISVPTIVKLTPVPTSTPIPLPPSLLANEMYSMSDYLKTKEINEGELSANSIGFIPWIENGKFVLLNSYVLNLKNIEDPLVMEDLMRKYFVSKNFYQINQKFYAMVDGSMVMDSVLSFFKENIRCSIRTSFAPAIYCGDINSKASDSLTILYHDLLSEHFPLSFNVVYMDDQYFFGGWDDSAKYARKINGKWVLRFSTQMAWDCKILYEDGVKPEIFNDKEFNELDSKCMDYSDKSDDMFYGQYSDFYKMKNGK